MLDNVGVRYPHRASGAKAPRTLRPLPLLRFAVSAIGGAHLCSIQYYLRFWLGICRTSLAVSALRIMRYCPKRVNHLSQCLFYFYYDMPGGTVNKYGYSTFCLRKALGVMPFSFRNTRLKLRMVPKPHCSATWVMGRLLPCSSAAAWLMRYWLIKS